MRRGCRLRRHPPQALSASRKDQRAEPARSHHGPAKPGRTSRGYAPWHFLNFLPLPHQHGSLRPMFSRSDLTIGRGDPAVDVLPPVIASVAVAADVVPPAAAIASAPASD